MLAGYYRHPVSPAARWYNSRYMQKIKVEQHTVGGGVWFAAWLFTIGYLKLSFAQGVLAIILWP